MFQIRATASGEQILLTIHLDRHQTSECSLSHSFKASFIRVCQLLPVARKAAMTSASKRTVVETLVGVCCLPLPRSTFCNESGNSENVDAFLKSSAVNSRTSPSASVKGKGFAMFASLCRVSFAKTDHPNAVGNIHKAQNMESAVEITNCDPANFAIIMPVIDQIGGLMVWHLSRPLPLQHQCGFGEGL